MRRMRSLAHRTTWLGRVVLAGGLLAALWIGTVQGVERSSREADDRRLSDRSAIAQAFAASVDDWIDAGRAEATTLARSSSGGNAAIDAFLATRPTFSTGAVVFANRSVAAADPARSSLIGLAPKPCGRLDENDHAVADDAFDELVTTARAGTTPVVSRIFDVPGPCEPGVAVAVATTDLVTVVIGDVADLTARLAAGSRIPAGHVFVVTGAVTLEPTRGIITTPPRISSFVQRASNGGSARERYAIGRADVLAAYERVAPEWALVLEQDAAAFDIELQQRPSVIVATLLTVVFAIVFALLAISDIRRVRAHRRAEVAKNVLFSIAGHELRTPLTVIRGFAELLADDWRTLGDKRRRELVERIAPQALRLDRLVQRLLVAAAMQAQTYTRPIVGDVEVRTSVESAAQRFRLQAPLHTILTDVPAVPAIALADSRSLDQVLDQLLDNAVKYSPGGGRVWLSVDADLRRVRITVEDEGVGLPMDRRRIFTDFVQGESVTKRVHDEGGVGLGLYIARTLIKDMRGSIAAEPRAGGGARFIVELPAARASTPSAA